MLWFRQSWFYFVFIFREYEELRILNHKRCITLKVFYFYWVLGYKLQIWKHRTAHIQVNAHTHTHTSQQVHRLIRVFPAVVRRSVGCRHHLPQLHRDLTPSSTRTQTHTSAVPRGSVSSEQCGLSCPQGRLLAGWWMCCSSVCPPFVNRVIEPQWHPALDTPPLSSTQEVVINRHIKPQSPSGSE